MVRKSDLFASDSCRKDSECANGNEEQSRDEPVNGNEEQSRDEHVKSSKTRGAYEQVNQVSKVAAVASECQCGGREKRSYASGPASRATSSPPCVRPPSCLPFRIAAFAAEAWPAGTRCHRPGATNAAVLSVFLAASTLYIKKARRKRRRWVRGPSPRTGMILRMPSPALHLAHRTLNCTARPLRGDLSKARQTAISLHGPFVHLSCQVSNNDRVCIGSRNHA